MSIKRFGRTSSAKHGGDGVGRQPDAPPPRLVSARQERREKVIRDELSGEADKERKKKVTLPKFSWDKK